MGLYVNPEEDKLQWLQFNGKFKGKGTEGIKISYDEVPKDSMLVIYIDNIMFTAAGVAYSEREFDYFMKDMQDTREKQYFIVPIEELKKVCPEWEHYVR